MLRDYQVSDIVNTIMQCIDGEARECFTRDDKEQYYTMSENDRFKLGLSMCSENRESFQDMLYKVIKERYGDDEDEDDE